MVNHFGLLLTTLEHGQTYLYLLNPKEKLS